MFKRSGKARWVGPVFAVQALRLHWEGKRELDEVTRAQAGRVR